MAKDNNKTNALRLLDRAKIDYKALFYDCDDFLDGVSIAERLNESVASTFKTLVTVGKSKNYFVFVVPVAKELDLKKAAKVSGDKKVELIHVKELLGLTGYIRGGVTPIGMKKKYPTYIHESCLKFDKMAISAGVCGGTLLIKPEDVIRITDAVTADIVQ